MEIKKKEPLKAEQMAQDLATFAFDRTDTKELLTSILISVSYNTHRTTIIIPEM